MLYDVLIWCFVFINILALLLCLYDKYAAKRRLWRIKESTLLIVSILGGSPTMLFTMYTIRHKTRHKKFTRGIPIIIILQVLAIIFFYYMLTK